MIRAALLRHFPTDWNAEGRLTGRADRPLNGEARARLAGLALPEPWDRARIVASPLMRARDTAAALADGRPVEADPRLVEQDWGDWEGRIAADLLADPDSGFPGAEHLGWHERPPGGETKAEAWARVRDCLAEIGAGDRPTLIVAHKGIMRIVLGVAFGGEAAPRTDVEIRRARAYPVTLGPDGRPRNPGPPIRLVPRP